MMDKHCSTPQILAELSQPLSSDRGSISRRRFLQAAALVGGVALLPSWMTREAEALPFAAAGSPSAKVLVHITMAGGNDGLNMVVPFQQGEYYDARGNVALSEESVLPLNGERALHPELGYLRSTWQRGELAVIDGVGTPVQDLSHFNSMAQWMSGRLESSSWDSGWLGRYLDSESSPYAGVHVGYSLPLLVRGEKSSAVGLPASGKGIISGSTLSRNDLNQRAAMKAFGEDPSSLVGVGREVALAQRSAVDMASLFEPSFGFAASSNDLAQELELCARLINADLGIRVFSINFGDFDTHTAHQRTQGDLFARFDEAIQHFYSIIEPNREPDTLLLTSSEFGRRVEANASNGTDHGDASVSLAIGSSVKGGFYGSFPSLKNLDRYGNLVPNVDYRNVYGTVLDKWLIADAQAVLGVSHEDIGFLDRSIEDPDPPDTTVPLTSTTTTTTTTTTTIPPDPKGGDTTTSTTKKPVADPYANYFDLSQTRFHIYRAQVSRLYLACFSRLPRTSGLEYWVGKRSEGVSLLDVAATLIVSEEYLKRYGKLSESDFVALLYKNILGRRPDRKGVEFWVGELRKGKSREQILIGFSESAEFVQRSSSEILAVESTGAVARLYLAYFGRKPDLKGMHYWNGSGLSLAGISSAFAASEEFKKRYGRLGDEAFVDLLYHNVLGRKADAGGRKHWVSSLKSGASRGDIMVGFSESPEFIARTRTVA